MYIPKHGGHTKLPKPATNVGAKGIEHLTDKAAYDQHFSKRNSHFDSMQNQQYD